MIYISSSCVKNKKIKDSVLELVNHGFKNIELSGGTEYYDGFEDELIDLKNKYNLNYICHNYFPPPIEPFVLNLASLNNEIYEKTFNHLANAIKLSKELGAKNFGFHAGFYVDIEVSELGKKIIKKDFFNKEDSRKRFCEAFNSLQLMAGELKLYIENNVFSKTNYKSYNGKNLFMLCNYDDYIQLKKDINFNLLLDVAHLKVSSKTLGLDFEIELTEMINNSEYIHVSDNDGFHDLNYGLKRRSSLVKLLSKTNLKDRNITLEVYDDIEKVAESYDILYEDAQ